MRDMFLVDVFFLLAFTVAFLLLLICTETAFVWVEKFWRFINTRKFYYDGSNVKTRRNKKPLR
jgi:hypothetical protein